MSIGSNILMLREKKSLSRQQLGDLIGVTRAQIGLYETGKNSPGKEKLSKLAKALDVSVAELYSSNLDNNPTSVGKSDQMKEDLLIETLKSNVHLLKEKIARLEAELSDCRARSTVEKQKK